MNLLSNLTGQEPVKTFSKVTNPEFGIRKHQPIACKVTLRGEKADKAIKMVLDGIGNSLREKQFDDQGNVSFGIAEHIDIPGIRYDPDIGIFGMNVSLLLKNLVIGLKEEKFNKRKFLKDIWSKKKRLLNI